MSLSVTDIVREYLDRHDYDGLYSCCCGCTKDDLMPCGEWNGSCKAGYEVACDPASCPADGDCDWHIGPDKERDDEKADNAIDGGIPI